MRVTGRDSDRELNQGLRWGHGPLAENQAPLTFSDPPTVATRIHAHLGHKDHYSNVKGCKRDFNSVYLIQKGKENSTLCRLSRLHAATFLHELDGLSCC